MKAKSGLLIVALVALLMRALFVLFFGVPPALLDAQEYKIMAENILAGQALDAPRVGEPDLPIRVPLYGYFIALVYRAFGVSEKAVVVVQILVSTLLSVLVFSLGRRYFDDDWAAFTGAMLLALHLPSIVHCGVLYPDTLFALLVGVSFFTILRLLERKTIYWAIATGLILGVSTLCKAAAQLVIILVIFLVFLMAKTSMRRRAALSAAALAAFLAVMAPWVIRNYVRFDAFVPTGTLFGFNFLTGAHEELTPPKGIAKPALSPEMLKEAEGMNWVEKDSYFLEEGKRMFIKNLSDLPRRATLKTGIIFIDYPRLSLIDNIAYDSVIGPRWARTIVWTGVLQNSLYVLLALAAAFSCRNTSGRIVLLTILLLLYFWAGYVLTRSLSRYSIPLYPFICLFAGCALSRWLRRCQGR